MGYYFMGSNKYGIFIVWVKRLTLSGPFWDAERKANGAGGRGRENSVTLQDPGMTRQCLEVLDFYY